MNPEERQPCQLLLEKERKEGRNPASQTPLYYDLETLESACIDINSNTVLYCTVRDEYHEIKSSQHGNIIIVDDETN